MQNQHCLDFTSLQCILVLVTEDQHSQSVNYSTGFQKGGGVVVSPQKSIHLFQMSDIMCVLRIYVMSKTHIRFRFQAAKITLSNRKLGCLL